MQELREIAGIMSQLSQGKNRMVFFDELGINTSIEQGVPLMWAICEHLLSLPRLTIVVSTHNKFLNRLASTYIPAKAIAFGDTLHRLSDALPTDDQDPGFDPSFFAPAFLKRFNQNKKQLANRFEAQLFDSSSQESFGGKFAKVQSIVQ